MFVFSDDVYITMQITFLTRECPPVSYVCCIVTYTSWLNTNTHYRRLGNYRLSLDCNGVFAIKAYRALPYGHYNVAVISHFVDVDSRDVEPKLGLYFDAMKCRICSHPLRWFAALAGAFRLSSACASVVAKSIYPPAYIHLGKIWTIFKILVKIMNPKLTAKIMYY